MLTEYVCPACGAAYDEVVMRPGDPAVPPCPSCGSWLLREHRYGGKLAASERSPRLERGAMEEVSARPPGPARS